MQSEGEVEVREFEKELFHQAEDVVAALDGRSLALAESCTSGLLTSTFAAVEGASEWFRGGVVAYQLDTKVALLGVDDDVPIVSREMAEQMARGAAAAMGADATVATTGAAGPSGHDGTPPGTVVLAAFVDGEATSVERHYDGAPREVIEAAARDSLSMLLESLSARPSRGSHD